MWLQLVSKTCSVLKCSKDIPRVLLVLAWQGAPHETTVKTWINISLWDYIPGVEQPTFCYTAHSCQTQKARVETYSLGYVRLCCSRRYKNSGSSSQLCEQTSNQLERGKHIDIEGGWFQKHPLGQGQEAGEGFAKTQLIHFANSKPLLQNMLWPGYAWEGVGRFPSNGSMQSLRCSIGAKP